MMKSFCLGILQPVVLLSIRAPPANAQIDPQNGTGQTATTPVPTTCDALTINYITHSLPQLCFTSTWMSPSTTSIEPTGDVRTDATENNAEISLSSEEPTAPTASNDPENESPDTVGDGATKSFMSFEDWKEMMLRETGQDPQDLRSRNANQHRGDDRTPPDMGHAGLGEEDEISLNFDSYLDNQPSDQREHTAGLSPTNSGEDEAGDPVAYDDGRPSIHRSKDAGKTCKERFSYSSFDAGATVLKSGPGAKNSKAILVENKDSYMLLECSARLKFVIVELSDDILIDTIVLANFEFFSSMIRHFKVSVSDRYPVKTDRWKDLGTFEARNSRDIQPFLVENPQIWAKYVRIEFLTHYGNEYYCPVSLLRVHGSRMLDSWKDSEAGRDEELQMDEPEQLQIETRGEGSESIGHDEPAAEREPLEMSLSNEISRPQFIAPSHLFAYTNPTCAAPLNQIEGDFRHNHSNNKDPGGIRGSSVVLGPSQGGTVPVPVSRTESSVTEDMPTVPPTTALPSGASSTTPANSCPDSLSLGVERAINSTALATSTKSLHIPESSISVVTVSKPTPPIISNSKNRTSGSPGSSMVSPPVQEGFYKAVTKRLQQVESNLTLSLKYVEDQARNLQDSLQRTEQKQISKANLFLENLNQTVLAELRNVREQYDQIWQSTVLALENQREQSQREIVALSTRLNLLADEVVFQKRMAIVQAVLLLSCLVLVIFSRGVSLPYLAPFADQTNGSPYGSTSSPRTYSRARRLYGTSYDPAREDSVSYVHQETEYISIKGDHTNTSSRLHNRHPSEEQAILLQCEGLSPPPTPNLADDLSMPDILPQSLETPTAGLRCPPKQQGNIRKPLPALPENPSSP